MKEHVIKLVSIHGAAPTKAILDILNEFTEETNKAAHGDMLPESTEDRFCEFMGGDRRGSHQLRIDNCVLEIRPYSTRNGMDLYLVAEQGIYLVPVSDKAAVAVNKLVHKIVFHNVE